MSDAVQIVLILCVTYIVAMLINRWRPSRPHNSNRQKGGAGR